MDRIDTAVVAAFVARSIVGTRDHSSALAPHCTRSEDRKKKAAVRSKSITVTLELDIHSGKAG